MRTLNAKTSMLLVVDFQGRLMPAIHEAALAMANARKLIDGAGILGVPHAYTEQNARGLGPTEAALLTPGATVVHKMTFNSASAPGFADAVGAAQQIVVTGCEAHVCVLQTVVGLIDMGKSVFVVRDAIGARKPDSKQAALERMSRHGAEIVTTEMVLFEWLETSEHLRFRDVVALVK